MSVACWVWLSGGDRSSCIKTVVSNKRSGCDVGSDGFALMVNEWETADQQLVLEWGDAGSGCNKLGSFARRAAHGTISSRILVGF